MPLGSRTRLVFRRGTALAVLCSIALASSLVFVFAFSLPAVEDDAVEYLALARSVAAGTGFSQDGGATPSVYRPPLFSGLLGAWFGVTGTSSPLSAGVLQCLLLALGVGTAFLLFLEWSSPAGAFAASLFLAVNPLLASRAAFVLQEPTILLFTTLGVLASVRLIRAPSPSRAALAGAAWGAAALAKIVCAFAPLLLLGLRLLPARLRWSWRAGEAALLLLCFAAALAPWTARNYLRFHRFIPVNAEARGLLEWNVAGVEIPGAPPGVQVIEEIRKKRLPEGEEKAALWKYIGGHPRRFLVDRTVLNAVRFAAPSRDWWVVRGSVRAGEHGAGYFVLVALFHAPLFLALALRTWRWVRGSCPPALGFVILFYWFYWAEHAVLWGDPRFGLAVYPILVGMVLAPAETAGSAVGPVAGT